MMLIVHLSRPLVAIRNKHREYYSMLVFRCLAATAVGIGIYGQLLDSRATAAAASWVNVHTLFGIAVYSAVTARFVTANRCNNNWPVVAGYEFCRHLSRLVYLLMYGLIGIAMAMTVVHRLRSIGTNPFATVPSHPFLEGFQPYLAHGIVALLLIRIEAIALLHYRTHRTTIS